MDTELARTLLSVVAAGNFIGAADRLHVTQSTVSAARHSSSYPDYIGPALTANIGWLGLQHILANGGSGYFPARLMRTYLEEGRLTALGNAPIFALPAYVVYPTEADPDLLGVALEAIRDAAAIEGA